MPAYFGQSTVTGTQRENATRSVNDGSAGAKWPPPPHGCCYVGRCGFARRERVGHAKVDRVRPAARRAGKTGKAPDRLLAKVEERHPRGDFENYCTAPLLGHRALLSSVLLAFAGEMRREDGKACESPLGNGERSLSRKGLHAALATGKRRRRWQGESGGGPRGHSGSSAAT